MPARPTKGPSQPSGEVGVGDVEIDSRPPAVGPRGGATAVRARRWRGRWWLALGAVMIFAGLVDSGVSLSSISAPMLREELAQPEGVLFGEGRSIRSDEFLGATPMFTGSSAVEGQAHLSPLAEEPDLVQAMPSGSFFESIVFFDTAVVSSGLLPDASAHAVYWWLPTLLVVVSLPAWLRRAGCPPTLQLLATGLVVLSPVVAWWSLVPLRTLSFTLAGCVAMLMSAEQAERRRWVRAGLLALAAGILFARITTSYVPWTIVIAMPIAVASLVMIGVRRGDRPRQLAAAASLGTGLLLLVAVFRENWSSFTAMTGTVYPGQRLSHGEQLPMGQVFSAPLLGGVADWPLTNTNLSEISSGYSVAVLGALAAAAVAWSRLGRRERLVLLALGLPVLLWCAWFMVPWPLASQHLPVLNRVMPVRAAQAVGLSACVLLAVALSRSGPIRWPVAAGVGVASTAVTMWSAVSLKRNFAPELSLLIPMLIAVAVGLLMAWLLLRPRSWLPVATTLALALPVVITVNPVQVGLGDLRDSELARYLQGSEGQEGGYWATDSLDMIAVLSSNGMPQLSGMQFTGPDRQAWETLDLDHQYEEIWNRGASYIRFEFISSGELTISLIPPDLITVAATPCELAGTDLPVRHILSPAELSSPCAVKVETLTWADQPMHIYDVQPVAG